MANKASKPTAKIKPISPRKSRKGGGGGSATGGGMEFQAAVTAIAGVHLLRGTPIGWLAGVVNDTPVAIWAETHGAGDDIRLELTGGQTVEIQAKKGLSRGDELWDSLVALAKAATELPPTFGVLAVAPDTSETIRLTLATDLCRLGEGRRDGLSDIGTDLLGKLNNAGVDVDAACSRIRIHVVHALEADAVDNRAAIEALRHVCADAIDANTVWNALRVDALASIRRRGRWQIQSLARLLEAEGVSLRANHSPISLVQQLTKWTVDTNSTFSLSGSQSVLPISSLIPFKASVSDHGLPRSDEPSIMLARYYSAGTRRSPSDQGVFDAEWLGRHYTKVVVMAGPGLGKTTLLTKLANVYATDGFVVLKVSLKWVAAAIMAGKSLEEAIWQQVASGTGIRHDVLLRSPLNEIVLLADGLDDCGNMQEDVAAQLMAFGIGRPNARIIVSTRPIGYVTAHLHDYRHYDLLAPDARDSPKHLASLVRGAAPEDSAEEMVGVAKRELARSPIKDAIAVSPQLLGMTASLVLKGVKLATSRATLYAQLFRLIEKASARTSVVSESGAVRLSILDVLGWELTANPLTTHAELEKVCATTLASRLNESVIAVSSRSEASVRYWEDVGLVERLDVDGADLMAFVHKTFAEYTASRHLSNLSTNERVAKLNDVIDRPEWSEVLSFATEIGLGEDLVSVLLRQDRKDRMGSLERAVLIAASEGAGISDDTTRGLIETALKLLATGVSGADFAGVALADLAQTRGSLVVRETQQLLTSGSSVERLVGFACTVQAFPERLKVSELRTALEHFLAELEPDWEQRPSISQVFSDGGRRDLMRRLSIAVLKLLPEEQVTTYAEWLLQRRPLDTMGFNLSVQTVLNARNIDWKPAWLRDEGSSVSLRSSLADMVKILEPPREWEVATRTAFHSIAEALLPNDASTISSVRISSAPQLWTLLDLAGVFKVSLSDFWGWTQPFDKIALRETLRVLVAVTKLDPNCLAREAAELLDRAKREPELNIFAQHMPILDTPDPNWAAVPSTRPDVKLLTRALIHESVWYVRLVEMLIKSSESGGGDRPDPG